MLQKTVKIFLVAILLSLSFTTYAFAKENEIFVQALTQEQLDQTMEEAQRKAQESMDEMNEIIDERREEFDSEKMAWSDPVVDDFNEVDKFAIGTVLGGALLSSSLFFFFFFFMILLALSGVVLNIIMIIDCYNREFKDRSVWLAVLIAGMLMGWGILPGVLYYFLVKKKLGPIVKKEESK